jgi:hypothetical protein
MPDDAPTVRIESGRSALSAPPTSAATERAATSAATAAKSGSVAPPPGPASGEPDRVEPTTRVELSWQRWRHRRPAVAALVVVAIVAALIVSRTTRSADRSSAATPSSSTSAPASGSPRGVPTTAAPPVAAPLAEVAALSGRPSPAPVSLDDAFCRGAFPPGGLTPTDLSVWNPGPSAPVAALDDRHARAEVSTIMARRFRNDDPGVAVTDALSLYDSVPVRTITNDDPTLRAALVELKGTLGESALQYAMASPVPLRLHFGTPPVPGFETGLVDDGTSAEIVIDAKDRGGDPALLAPLIFRELLHQAGRALFDQALVEDLLQDRVLLEQLRDDPEALTPTTDLTREARWSALGQLDTRVGSTMTGFRSDAPIRTSTERDDYHSAVSVVRGSSAQPRPSGASSDRVASSPILTAVFQAMAADGSTPSPADYDADTVSFVDAHPGLSSCDQMLAAGAIGALPPGSAYDAMAQQYRAGLPR